MPGHEHVAELFHRLFPTSVSCWALRCQPDARIDQGAGPASLIQPASFSSSLKCACLLCFCPSPRRQPGINVRPPCPSDHHGHNVACCFGACMEGKWAAAQVVSKYMASISLLRFAQPEQNVCPGQPDGLSWLCRALNMRCHEPFLLVSSLPSAPHPRTAAARHCVWVTRPAGWMDSCSRGCRHLTMPTLLTMPIGMTRSCCALPYRCVGLGRTTTPAQPARTYCRREKGPHCALTLLVCHLLTMHVLTSSYRNDGTSGPLPVGADATSLQASR